MLINYGKLIKGSLSLFIFSSLNCFAISDNFYGRVVDDNGDPMIGVSVMIKGSGKGTITDQNGVFQFSSELSKNDILVFRYMGYGEKEIVSLKNGDNVILLEDTKMLNDVVVTALGIKREKRSLGYATQSIDSESISAGNDPNILNKLAGQLAGVKVTGGNSGAGSSTYMVIRGESSLSNDNQPLYVVDGVPINNNIKSVLNGTPQEIDYGNGAGEINPDDVENIQVLKGATASALYGSRAANGVVLITTKSGKGNKKFRVNINSTTTFENVSRLPEYQNKWSQGLGDNFEYWDGANGKGTQDHQDMSWGREIDGTLVPQFDSPSYINGVAYRGGDVFSRGVSGLMGAAITATPLVANPNNVKDFFETGVTTSNNIAISGNNENGDVRLSYTNLYSKGVIPNVDLNRNTISFSSSYKFTPKFNSKVNANLVHSKSSNRPSMSYGPENPMYTFAWFGRQVNIESLRDYWQRGYEGTKQYHFNSGWNDNPFFTMYENTNGFERYRFYGNVALSYQFNDEFKLTGRTGIDFFNEDRSTKRAYSTQRFLQGAYKKEDLFFSEWNSDIQLEWNKDVNDDFSINAFVGGSMMTQFDSYLSGFANGLSVPGVYNLGNASIPVKIVENSRNKEIYSLFASAQLSYRNFFYLNVTGRNDYSSTLTKVDGSGNNSYFYPSFSGSAILSDIFEMSKNVVTYWSLRGGYAEVGSDTDPYSLEATYNYTDPYGSNAGVTLPGNLPNANLKPERMSSYEIGTDIRFFNNRLGADLTYYNTINKNQIINIPVSTSTGYSSRIVNGGKIRNRGVELLVTGSPIKNKSGLNWDTRVNFSKNTGTVLSLIDGVDQYVYSWTAIYSDAEARVYAIAKKDGKMGDLYGTGFKRNEDGKIIVDASGLPVADPTLKKLGNYNPDFKMGWGNSFSYKGVSLDFLLDWSQGGIIVSRTFGMGMESGVLKETENRNPADMVVDGVVWNTESNSYIQNTKQVSPRDYYRNLYRRFHEEQLTFDATYVKLREVKIGYTLPKSLIRPTGIENLSFALVGRNLFMWTPYIKHIDPEATSSEGSMMTYGVEEMSYPSTRSFGFNINLTF